MYPKTAAERRQSVATADGRGLELHGDEPRSGGRIFRRYAARLSVSTVPTAFGRVAQLQFEMVCERPPRSLRSRLPIPRGRVRLQREETYSPLP